MKAIFTAAAALALLAGAAQAASPAAHERPDSRRAAAPITRIELPAAQLLSTKELVRRGVAADATLSVTAFPSSGIVETSGRDN